MPERASAFEALIASLLTQGVERGAWVVAVKGLAEDVDQYQPQLKSAGFSSLKSLPVVVLPVPFSTLDSYLGSLKGATAPISAAK